MTAVSEHRLGAIQAIDHLYGLPPLSRRGFFAKTGGATAALTVACEAPPPQDFTFPQGQTIDQEFLQEQGNSRRIIETAKRFPSANIIYPSKSSEIKFTETSGLGPVAATTKTKSLSLYENGRSTLVMTLQFEPGVYVGDSGQFNNARFSSAFLIATRGNDVLVASSRPSIFQFEGQQFKTPIRSVQLNFPVSYKHLYDHDTVIILNRGILQHQPDRAIFIPARLHLISPAQVF